MLLWLLHVNDTPRVIKPSRLSDWQTIRHHPTRSGQSADFVQAVAVHFSGLKPRAERFENKEHYLFGIGFAENAGTTRIFRILTRNIPQFTLYGRILVR